MNEFSQIKRPCDLRDRIAQLMFVRIGSNLPPVRTVEEDEAAIAQLLREHAIGGLLLFNGRWPQTRETLRRLQDASRYLLLVASDIERGVGQQIHGLPLFPHAMAFDQLGNDAEEIVAEFARVTAAAARDCGINVALAPVADVNTDPRNPIIATRAFGQDPQRAARLVSAFVRSAEAAGLLTTAKHFPGHGNTHQDSHDALPVVDRSRAELTECDLVPFQAAIDAGTSAIMSAHVAFPQIDPRGHPATLSSPILRHLLRDQLGFRGAVCTDSLLMAGVQQTHRDEGDLAVAALVAGADILLDVADPPKVIDGVARAVDAGQLPAEVVDGAFDRVWQLKQRAFGWQSTEPAIELESSAEKLAETTARRAIVTRGDASLPTTERGAGMMLLVLAPHSTGSTAGNEPLADELRRRLPQAEYVALGGEPSPGRLAEIAQRATAARHLVIAVVVKPAAWHRFGLPSDQATLVRTLTESRPATLVSLGVPYVLDAFPAAVARVCTFSDVPASERALVELLAAGGLENERKKTT